MMFFFVVYYVSAAREGGWLNPPLKLVVDTIVSSEKQREFNLNS